VNMTSLYLLVFVVVFGAIVLVNAIRVVREYERLVVFRLGRLIGTKGPGLVLLWPVIDRAVKVGLRTVTMDVPPQDIITRDNVTVKVNAVIYFRVIDASQAVVQVENFLYATSQIAQTTLRSILGQQELDELLSERERRAKVINAEGEYQAAARLAEAAAVIGREPAALQLRYLQTLAEIATENNSTSIFPVPVDFLRAFMSSAERSKS